MQNVNPAESSAVVHQIEVKAYLDDFDGTSDRVAALADAEPEDRVQHDIFFHCRSGRLKLRSSGCFHDLIYYRRNDDYGPSESFYQCARTENPAALRTSLVSAFGEVGRVKKFRRSFKIGGSTVHLDRVGGLGDFLEIKTKLNPGTTMGGVTMGGTTMGGTTMRKNVKSSSSSSASPLTIEQGSEIVNNLMRMLEVDLFQLVDTAYIDLINERAACLPQ